MALLQKDLFTAKTFLTSRSKGSLCVLRVFAVKKTAVGDCHVTSVTYLPVHVGHVCDVTVGGYYSIR
jgi:hypothetical protein